MNVLVATPIAEHKLYSLDDWVAATAGHPRAMSIDREDEYISPLIDRHGVHVIVFDPPQNDDPGPFQHPFTPRKYNEAYRVLFEYAKANGFPYVLSLQSDNIPLNGVDVVRGMEQYWEDGIDFLVQLSPWRASYGRPERKGFEMGCTLATTDTWFKTLAELPHDGVPLYWAVYQDRYRSKQIDVIELDHPDE